MEPITVLYYITIAGIILLLGLFGACLRYIYITVGSWTEEASRGKRNADGLAGDGETDEAPVRGGTDDDRAIGAGDTGDFVFENADESRGSGDPRRQL